ncbi:SDR family oxidoreductase [Vandammella animalimorsus]|uniref:Short chain dehydrogenase n=1 Tax=Vandammella animalimorsus TaxID=2029117 RepID=A0A2A2B0K3_9BURK|nr:SDR family oxidoreductase [Vandammella animalimorsus]PAT43459.1 short chain dehydrogenase [Vandammella animalimorsus]
MPPNPSPATALPAGHARPTVLVTGAGLRLGAAIAVHLAQQGWNVAVHYRHSSAAAQATVQACRAAGADSDALAADFDDEEQTRALLPAALARFGRVDAIVNSASRFEFDDASDFSYASLERHLRSNTAAPIVLAQALQAHLQARAAAVATADGDDAAAAAKPQGVVVNLLDQKLWNQNPDFLSYTLSKAALEAAGTMLALALAPWVRVVGVAPGLTLTSEFLDASSFARLHQLSPLGRSSTPEDVAAAVHFALSNASLTGTTLLVDGGQHLMRFERDFSMMAVPGTPPKPR